MQVGTIKCPIMESPHRTKEEMGRHMFYPRNGSEMKACKPSYCPSYRDSKNEYYFTNPLCMNAGHFVKRQVALGDFITPTYQRSPNTSALPKKINSWDKSFIRGGEYDVGA